MSSLTGCQTTQYNQPLSDDAMQVHRYQLANGLKIYISENDQTNRFFARISVRAGSKHDPPETTGLAHYLEHLLFKGSQQLGTSNYAEEKKYLDQITDLYEQHFNETDEQKRNAIYAQINKVSQKASAYAIPNELTRLYRTMGEEGLNAHTWHEETVYHVSMPANQLSQWLHVEADRFMNPVFRLFQPELEIVYEEKNRAMDNKGRTVHEMLFERLFKKHPYGQQTTIGTTAHLKNPSIKNIINYFNRYYVPNNMAIAIAGNVDHRQVIKEIEQTFGHWAAQPLPEKTFATDGAIKGRESFVTHYLAEPYVTVGFRTQGRNHADADALRLIDMILDNQVAGLINVNLTQPQRVRQAGSYPMLLNDGGAQVFYGVPKPGQSPEQIERLLLDQVELIKKGDFPEWLLAAVLTDYKKRKKEGLLKNSSRASAMSNAFLAKQSWAHAVGQIDRLSAVTRQQVIDVANRYFGDDYVVGYRLDGQHNVPPIDKPKIDTIAIDDSKQSDFAKSILAMPVKSIEPDFLHVDEDYSVTDLASGALKFYHVRNPVNDLFQLSMTIDIGSRQAPWLPFAVKLHQRAGTDQYDPKTLRRHWYELGADFSIEVNTNSTVIHLSGMDETFDQAFALMMASLEQAKIGEDDLEKLVANEIARRADRQKSFDDIGQALDHYHRYGDQSDFLNAPSNKDLKKVQTKQLFSLIKSLLTYRHQVSYVGSLDQTVVGHHLKKHYIKSSYQPTPDYRRLSMTPSDQTTIYFVHKPMAQSVLRIAYEAPRFELTQVPSIELFNNFFGLGMSGVIFQELREARALAYVAYARYATPARQGDTSLMFGYIGCQADKTVEATKAFVALLDDPNWTPERGQASIDAMRNQYRTIKTPFMRIPETLYQWKLLGTTHDPRIAQWHQLQGLSSESIKAFHKMFIAGRPKRISIVGDRDKIDLKALSGLGQIKEVAIEDLFSD